MKTLLSEEDQRKRAEFTKLATKVKKEQSERLQKRILLDPHPSLEENALGAFMEMYEPHLVPIVMAFLEKGILIEPSSGFDKNSPENQMVYGSFYFNEKIAKMLENIHVIVQKNSSKKNLKFSPNEATLEAIIPVYNQIVDVFPVHTGDIQISQTADAKKFRRLYVPNDSQLKQTRLFEILMYEIQEQVSAQVVRRLRDNPEPTQCELNLGIFVEMIEPQVRDAVLELYEKGYSTDVSGFMGESGIQRISGDFSLPNTVRQAIESEGVSVTTNNSGYTNIQFSPAEPDLDKIRTKWMHIVSLFPHKKTQPSVSMTLKAREFRNKYKKNIKA